MKLMMKSLSLVFALGLVSCENYTSSPLCSSTNVVNPFDLPGFEGVYEYTVQNDDFSTETSVVDLTDPENLKVLFDDEEGNFICVVGDKILLESKDDYELGYYTYDRLFITDRGLEIHKVFFDKNEVEEAGLATKVFDIPEQVQKILGQRVSRWLGSAMRWVMQDEEGPKGLLVVNDGAEAAQVASLIKTSNIAMGMTRR